MNKKLEKTNSAKVENSAKEIEQFGNELGQAVMSLIAKAIENRNKNIKEKEA